jgi:hypothetical protein
VQRRRQHGRVLRPVRDAGVILAPGCFVRVLVQVAVRDVVMLAVDGAAQAREVAFGLIGAGAISAVRLRVVDPVRGVERLQLIPMRAFVGV